MTSLVIVESPAKAKTLARILGPDYKVEASFGHIRDLPQKADEIPGNIKKEPWARLGVNVKKDFEPVYVIPAGSKKHIKRLKDLLKDADEVLLATDEDREGESISWHVVEVLKPTVPVRRIVFHEITDEAIHEALERPREINTNLVRAQESRRILDRLFGYELSPVLWKKVRTGLSAGRVQSVAVRLCVLREKERRRFKSAGYWDAKALFEKDGQPFTARLSRLGTHRLATGQDFDPATGELQRTKRVRWLKTREDVETAIAGWQAPWTVTKVEEKPITRRPQPPYTTATLQQEANRKLRFSARHTMRVAQRLYEGIEVGDDRQGLITYMRTDSMTLANRALAQAQHVIESLYGPEYTEGPRRYVTKSKGAQEAHEAIRPTEINRTPDQLRAVLTADEMKLYELIWNRTVASQMVDARLRRTTAEITAPVRSDREEGEAEAGLFIASGTVVEFPGFLEVKGSGSLAVASGSAEKNTLLPALRQGEACEPSSVEPRGRDTAPPARYTEAALIKKLEAEGIGRPSTYASIIETIQARGYVLKQNGALIPTFTAFAVTKLLETHFGDYVDTQFTAKMERQLDEIANGNLDWKHHLHDFYFGEGPEEMGLDRRIEKEGPSIDYPTIEIGKNPETDRGIVVKVGRFGPYLVEDGGDGERTMASVPDDVAPADLTIEEAVRLLEKAKKGAQMLGHDDGEPIYLAHGRFGAYVQLGETPERGSKAPKPKRASLPKDVKEEDVTLELALKWLSLPRSLGEDPATGEEILALSGRFGPFIKRGSDTRSLEAGDDVYTIDQERALLLLAQPKSRGRGRRSAAAVLKEFGEFSGGGTLQLRDGRYGPYLTDGNLNASLPKGMDPEKLSAEQANEILREKGKPPKRKRKKS